MKFNYHIIVIGGGSGGLVVAAGAASIGARVALVEGDKMGGDCLNTGCVPSKSFLRPSHLAAELSVAKQYGINSSGSGIDIKKVMNRVRSVIKSIEPHDSVERFESLGVRVFREKGTVIDRNTVKAGSKTITGKYLVIATGSEPAVPPIPGLSDVPYLTNKNIFNIKTQPEKLIILGGGPIGLELGQGFRHLGSEVVVIDMLDHLFPKDDPEVSPLMENILTGEGIKLELSAKIIGVKKKGKTITVEIEKQGKKQAISGDAVLVSLGRKPVSGDMGLEEAGIELDRNGFIKTNRKLQTAVKNIYACGDVTGPWQFTHMAGYQAGIIIRNIVFPLIKSSADYSSVPWNTYTRPEIAHAGYTEAVARQEKKFKNFVMVPLGELDRALTEDDTRGFLKLILGKKNRIIGATMVGNKAGEIIPLASLAIKLKQKAGVFMSMTFAYPSEAEIFRFASLDLARKSFKPWMKTVIQKVLLR